MEPQTRCHRTLIATAASLFAIVVALTGCATVNMTTSAPGADQTHSSSTELPTNALGDATCGVVREGFVVPSKDGPQTAAEAVEAWIADMTYQDSIGFDISGGMVSNRDMLETGNAILRNLAHAEESVPPWGGVELTVNAVNTAGVTLGHVVIIGNDQGFVVQDQYITSEGGIPCPAPAM